MFFVAFAATLEAWQTVPSKIEHGGKTRILGNGALRGGSEKQIGDEMDIEESPLGVIRRRGRRSIHVTELTSQDWCEMQLDYVLRWVFACFFLARLTRRSQAKLVSASVSA